MPMGNHEHGKNDILNMGVQWTTGPVTVLGINITNKLQNLYELSFKPVLEKIKYLLHTWKKDN